MRKLAPMFITTSILLAAGSAFAADTMGSTDKNGNPSVNNNTQQQPLSYSDKSNTAKGTNAKMDDTKSTVGTSSTGDKLNSGKVDSNTAFATDEDKRDAKPSSHAGDKADVTAKPAKAKKANVAHTSNTSKLHKDTMSTGASTDTNVTGTGTEKMEKNPPLSATKGEAANSLTGKSAGQ